MTKFRIVHDGEFFNIDGYDAEDAIETWAAKHDDALGGAVDKGGVTVEVFWPESERGMYRIQREYRPRYYARKE